jgi:shikimate dehydrogenase
MFNPQMQLNLVIGYPLTHSKSPLLHNTVYEMLGCNAVLLACDNPNLAEVINAMKALSVGFAAVTMPFKEAILPYLDVLSPEVSELKAANTVIVREGKLHGYNTDVEGIAYALRHVSLAQKNILIIGAGGAARAMAYVAKQNNANLFWMNRTEASALALIDIFGGTLVNSPHLHHLQMDIIVNTTPQGLFPEVHISPLSEYLFKPEQIIFDMVYNPVETRFLKEAKAKGAHCISGLDMFIGQGLRQIELWLDKTIEKEGLMNLIKSKLFIK